MRKTFKLISLMVLLVLIISLVNCSGAGAPSGGDIPTEMTILEEKTFTSEELNENLEAYYNYLFDEGIITEEEKNERLQFIESSRDYGMEMYAITYNPAGVSGRSSSNWSGLVVIPGLEWVQLNSNEVGRSDTRQTPPPAVTPLVCPMVSIQHPTLFDQSRVPSTYTRKWYKISDLGYLADGDYHMWNNVNEWVKLGYIVVMADYPGYGNDKDTMHPFCHAESLSKSVVDMIQRAKKLVEDKNSETGVSWNRQLFLAGHSEGGYATMAAAKYIQSNPQLNLTVHGIAPLAGPYYMSSIMRSIITEDQEFTALQFLAFMTYGYNSVYRFEDNPGRLFKNNYGEEFEYELMHGENDGQKDTRIGKIFEGAKKPSDIFVQEYLDELANDKSDYTEALKKNDVWNWVPKMPVLLVHAELDQCIPYENALKAYEQFPKSVVTLETLRYNWVTAALLIKGDYHAFSYLGGFEKAKDFCQKLRNNVVIRACSNPSEGGKVAINGGVFGSDVSVSTNEEVSIGYEPKNGYTFTGWYENGRNIGIGNPRRFAANADRVIEARFTKQVTITAQSDPAAGGDVRINSGTWGDSKSVTVNSGTQVTVETAAASGYTFDGWYDGSAKVSSNTSLTVTATANKTYRAKFNTVSTLTITQHPQSQTKTEGESVTFNVVASGGTPPYSYQWRKNGTNINGATSQSYTKNNLVVADAGQYSVVVTDSSGVGARHSITSNDAQLTVELTKYTVYAECDPASFGYIRIDGAPWRSYDHKTVDRGTQVNLEAEPSSGYDFTGWYDEDGLKVSNNTAYTVTVNEEMTFIARFRDPGMPLLQSMVRANNGTFSMGNTRNDSEGDENEKPVHQVTLTYSYWIGKYEVTFQEYDAFCDATGRTKPSDNGWGRGKRPVMNVSWWDAIAFCNWLSSEEGLPYAYDSSGNLLNQSGQITTDISQVKGYRLPTEAEWEYAARGGQLSEADYKYSGDNDLDYVGWYNTNRTREVGQLYPNELDTYDMSGNVNEWCHDKFSDSYYDNGNMVNPIGPSNGSRRAVRGGSYNVYAQNCRISRRISYSPGDKKTYIGFRVARY
ncbi:MAG TPA: SUMF1/EgtB/PvdO family nonheme iron enzyme [Tenuifilaceae bacterium]|nr:SUMF1/EgtB/PvdO family nonheme iron enzyme [Tenuifilaceae bacterium]